MHDENRRAYRYHDSQQEIGSYEQLVVLFLNIHKPYIPRQGRGSSPCQTGRGLKMLASLSDRSWSGRWFSLSPLNSCRNEVLGTPTQLGFDVTPSVKYTGVTYSRVTPVIGPTTTKPRAWEPGLSAGGGREPQQEVNHDTDIPRSNVRIYTLSAMSRAWRSPRHTFISSSASIWPTSSGVGPSRSDSRAL